jgi:hypothetical protein
MAALTCYGEGGKHHGTVKRRRVLRYNGVYERSLYSGALCDGCWHRDLRNAVRRGNAAARILQREGTHAPVNG